MNFETKILLEAITYGAMGGLASYLYVAYRGFKDIAIRITKSKEAVRQRIYCMLCRICLGVFSAVALSRCFLDAIYVGNMSESKFEFIAILAGFTTSTLVSTSESLKVWLKKI